MPNPRATDPPWSAMPSPGAPTAASPALSSPASPPSSAAPPDLAPPPIEPQRRRILDAGLAVFARYGFRTTTMGFVAAEADLSRQALYNYFPGKEALFEACAADLHAGARVAALAAAGAARAAGHDPAGVLTAQLAGSYAAFFARMSGTPHAAELLDEMGRRCRPIMAEHAQLTTTNLATTLLAEVEAGRLLLDPDQAPRLAAFLLAAVRGLKAAVPPIAPEALGPDLAAMVRLLVDGAAAQARAALGGASQDEAP